jgi:hypothetical protein
VMEQKTEIPLSVFTGTLEKVSPEHDRKPINSIADPESRFGPWAQEYIRKYFFRGFTFYPDYRELPLQAFEGFTFDELCKIEFAQNYMEKSVREVFDTNPKFEIVRKIKNSMWRWGGVNQTWNDLVDVYNGIRAFSFHQDPDFEVRFDYTPTCHSCGHSKFQRIYLDGVFAFLVYYKNKRVMTLGFSVVDGRKLLIQQVQMANRTGNRFLFKLTKNYLEYVIDRFRESFPTHDLYLVDGKKLLERTLRGYQESCAITARHVSEYETLVAEHPEKSSYRQSLTRHQEECVVLENKIKHLEYDMLRISAFYANPGKYFLGEPDFFGDGGRTHYRLDIAPPPIAPVTIRKR